ncbi:MAG: efflux RND transporter permease subunit [Nitrospiraceae bacterium]
MKLSEVSIRRPVLATVMTLVVVLFGVISFMRLQVREYPDIESPVISVMTVYPGAGARLIETDITTALEEALGGIEGLKTLNSISQEEVSVITMEFELARDLDAAASDVRDRVFNVRAFLPKTVQEPIILKARGDAEAIMWLSLYSDRHTELEITDFADRYIKDRLAALPGVSTVWIGGGRYYAMRIWLDPDRLASRQLTVQDVEEALQRQNVAIPSGRIESERLEFSVRTRGELQTAEQFDRLIIASHGGYPVRLQEVGHAEIGAADDRKLLRVNGKATIGLGVVKRSKANALAVGRAVHDKFQEIQQGLPDGMALRIASDLSEYIERSIHEVYLTMGISILLVVLVMFAFLGNVRATIIPTVAIPASVLGTFALMYAAGFSLNVLTLLGLVLAIGLVVDDAIVMLENVYRRVELGQSPYAAALDGSREIGFAVVSTTIALVVVFVPIVFISGATARLFSELALAVAGSVLISGFIALTLTPMMSAYMLRRPALKGPARVSLMGRRLYGATADLYRRTLESALASRLPVMVLGVGSVVLGVFLFTGLDSELAPLEDSGAFLVDMTAPEGSTIRYTDHYVRDIEAALTHVPEIESYLTWVATGNRPTFVNRAGIRVTLKDWQERERSQQDIAAEVSTKLAQMPGLQASVVQPRSLAYGSGKTPVQFIVGGASYEELGKSVDTLVEALKGNPGLTGVTTDLYLSKPELDVHVNRDKAADVGVSLATIGRTLETLLGGRMVTRFMHDGKEYPVMVKVHDRDRVKPSDINALYVRGHLGELVQLGNLVAVQETVTQSRLNHADKARSATITAGLAPGYTLGEALDDLEATARAILPAGTPIGYAGESKAFKEASSELYLTFGLALLVIYLVLAAQFESFLHPFTILLSIPPAITGALMTLSLFGGTLNVYSEIGMIMLVGLASKNAILIVDVANRLQSGRRAAGSAVAEAAALRFRPILMTTSATILGAVPLVLATGAGAAGRHQIGSVIVGGMIFSTVLTLFIVPVVYVALSRRVASKRMPTDVPAGSDGEAATPITPRESVTIN